MEKIRVSPVSQREHFVSIPGGATKIKEPLNNSRAFLFFPKREAQSTSVLFSVINSHRDFFIIGEL